MERREFPVREPVRSIDLHEAVIVTPNAMDAQLGVSFLRDEGMRATAVPGMGEMLSLPLEEIGCLVLAEESLTEQEVPDLQRALQAQPPWSDIPIIVLAREGASLRLVMDAAFPQAGNVTLLQRPLHPVALISAVHVGLRARARQSQVRELLEEKQQALRQRDEFLAMLAHELRNPLAPIRNAVHLLGSLPRPEPLFAKCRGMIEKQVRHISRLVEDLLDVSRLELGKVSLQPQRVDVDEVVAAAVEAVMADSVAQGHTVHVHKSGEALAVMADAVRLEQVVANLVMNAAKFTPTGGTITVSVAREPGHVRISVADTGIGIPPDKLDRIFDLFAQEAVSIARSNGGLGIGLTLVKRLVQLHGGSVRARSAGAGQGATFEVRLPLAPPVAAARPSVVVAPATDVPRRVLIVEDGKDTRDSLGMLIEAWGHQVFYAANGPEGVDRACNEHPDVVLVDIGLPGFDGYQVARTIREHCPACREEVRLIALTGYGQPADRAMALASGFDAHVLKPVEPAALREMLA